MCLCLPPQLYTWVCTIKGWVVLQSLLLASEYFAICWALRYVVFPLLKSCFENFLVYQILHGPLGNWITLVKAAFYASLACFGAGIAGIIGALFEIQILLWLYAIYLLGAGAIGAKKLYDTLQSVLAEIDNVKSACKKVPGIFSAFGIDCDTTFDKLQTYTWIGAGILLLCQSLTLICVVVLIRRIHKRTGFWLFTFCGHPRRKKGQQQADDGENLLGKIPLGRQRRRAIASLRAARSSASGAGSTATVREKVASLPPAEFELPRRRSRRDERRKASRSGAEAGSGSGGGDGASRGASERSFEQTKEDMRFSIGKKGKRRRRGRRRLVTMGGSRSDAGEDGGQATDTSSSST
ncbi:hypothetical protein NBRC10512_005117 [Rhodotorula toruloides]|uniref:RHTO0S02e14840g1_1 n=2 Tax=Rhodotorula toruloides TaxID=5286 RepID=A0A061AIQ6_RHOTO|nr:uncharacterized protein RHTO_07124 [Rhodotorula toruloides NP11]EMS23390.1 hypothetical protein RHTO_07124 [Rhodotorula toruloides NP11]CDR37434.1 RHTO0S02e14840g1_1 [Rhodotorula toruloides]